MEIKIDKQLIDDAVHQAVKEIKEKYVWIPKDGLTNGEVIKTLFPIEGIYKEEYVEVVFKGQYHTIYFTLDWWNAPYKKGGEPNE